MGRGPVSPDDEAAGVRLRGRRSSVDTMQTCRVKTQDLLCGPARISASVLYGLCTVIDAKSGANMPLTSIYYVRPEGFEPPAY